MDDVYAGSSTIVERLSQGNQPVYLNGNNGATMRNLSHNNNIASIPTWNKHQKNEMFVF